MNELAEIDTGLEDGAHLEGGDELFSGIDEVMGSDSGQQEQPLPIEQEDAPEQQDKQPQRKEEAGSGQQPPKKDEVPKKDETPQDQQQGTKKDYPENIKSTKARHDFDVLRGERDKERERANALDRSFKELQSKFTALESKGGVNSPEVATLEKQIKDLNARLQEQEQIIAFKAVEEIPEFREKVTQPKKESNDDLDQLIETYSLNSAAIDKALFEPNKFKRNQMLTEITKSIPEEDVFAKTELQAAVNKWIGAHQQEETLRKNAAGNREMVESKKREEEASKAIQRKREWETETGNVEKILRDKLPELFEQDEKLWKSISQNHNAVKDFDKLPSRAKAFANMSSHAVMPLIREVRSLKAELKKANDTITANAKAQPGAGGGRGTSGGSSRPEDDVDEEGGDFLSHLEGQLGQ